MRIMLIETAVEDGHHTTYLRGLIMEQENEYMIITPSEIDKLPKNTCQIINQMNFVEKKLLDYIKWMKKIQNCAKSWKPDVIHFLDGDSIMRYFAIGFRELDKYRIIITYHHFFKGIFRKISYRCMAGKNRSIVVHTESIRNELINQGLKNVFIIDYPVFLFEKFKNADIIHAKLKIGVPLDLPVLGFIGATVHYKGLDLLLEALKHVHNKFCLLIAGKEGEITSSKIESYKAHLTGDIFVKLAWLSDEEYINSIVASDFIILPYRKEFDGASGPLLDGIIAQKVIIGANHGSMGDVIKKNELGYTFESENINDMALCIDKALESDVCFSEKRNEFYCLLNPQRFKLAYNCLYTGKLF